MICGIDDVKITPIVKDINAAKRNFAFNLVSRLSDFKLSLINIRPAVKKVPKQIKKYNLLKRVNFAIYGLINMPSNVISVRRKK